MGKSSSTPSGLSGVESSFAIGYFPDVPAGCEGLDSNRIESLTSNGFTKGVCPFGVLIVGTDSYPSSYLQFSANVVANLLDADADGQVDLPVVQAGMKTVTSGNYMAGGNDQASEDAFEQVEGFGYCYGL